MTQPTTRARDSRSFALLTGLLAALFAVAGCNSSGLYPIQTGSAGYKAHLVGSSNAAGAPTDSRAAAAQAEAFAGPALGEEIWVIAKADGVQPLDDDTPGAGTLIVPAKDDGKKFIPVPLQRTDVKASVSAYIASVDLTQQFHNPFDSKIEAVYVFPLPQNAAVNEFVMTIGERRIRGIIREKAEAERVYHEARTQGYVASLLTQQRPNVFTQKVANIEPGKRIDIHIKYLHTLRYEDGWYEWVFPMVVGPRFNPAGYADGIGAVARGKRGASGQSTEVEYLAPGEDGNCRVSLSVDVDAGVNVERLVSVNHKVLLTRNDEPVDPDDVGDRFTAAIPPCDNVPNKDFVLRWKVAGDRIKASLLTEQTGKGKYFSLMLYPPAELTDLPRRSMEMVFVIDASGSMRGRPIDQAKDAAMQGLRRLQPSDTFQVIQFSDGASKLGGAPLPATAQNQRAGRDYIRGMSGNGGTRMIEGLKAALDSPHDPQRLRTVTFLTDGYIGNDREIIGEVARRVGAARIFSFGVGSSPNRYLMDRMAKQGRGAAAYLSNNQHGDEVMDQFFDAVSRAALTDLEIEFGSMRVDGVYPRRLPDLFVGRPVIIAGRYTGELPKQIVVSGRAASEGGTRRMNIVIPIDEQRANHTGIETVWARAKIAEFYDQLAIEPSDELVGQIRRTAIEYNLMSAYTGFVAVDTATRTAGEFGTTVRQPLPVPDGVEYETTVQR